MGCIPVFVGPPFHAMPLEQEVDYQRSAVFINVTNSKSWLGDMLMATAFPTIPRVRQHGFESRVMQSLSVLVSLADAVWLYLPTCPPSCARLSFMGDAVLIATVHVPFLFNSQVRDSMCVPSM